MRVKPGAEFSSAGNANHYFPKTFIRLQAAISRLDVFYGKAELTVHNGAQLALCQQRDYLRRKGLRGRDFFFQVSRSQDRAHETQALSQKLPKIDLYLPAAHGGQ